MVNKTIKRIAVTVSLLMVICAFPGSIVFAAEIESDRLTIEKYEEYLRSESMEDYIKFIKLSESEKQEWINSHSVSGDLSDEHWNGTFMTSPLVGFHSLDDIFNWLEEFRKEDHPLTVSLEEARRMGITRL